MTTGQGFADKKFNIIARLQIYLQPRFSVFWGKGGFRKGARRRFACKS